MDAGRIAFTTGGKWLTAPLSSPLEVQPGDTIEVEGETVHLKRDGYYIDSRTIGSATDFALQPFAEPTELTHVVFYQEKPMPAAAVTINEVTVNQTSGTITAKFSNGNSREFTNWEQLVGEVDNYDTDDTHAENLLLLGVVRRSPDGSNLDILNGSSCTIDGSAANPVQFSINE